MKKIYKRSYRTQLFIAVMLGAMSQPLISGSFLMLNGWISNLNDADIGLVISKCVCMILLGLLFSFSSHAMKTYYTNEIAAEIREKTFSSILHLSIQKFHAKDSAEYYNDVLKKVDIWRDSKLRNFWEIIENILELIFILALIFFINYWLGIIMIISLIPLVINNVFFPNIIEKKYAGYIEKDNHFVAKLKEYLSGFDTIKHIQQEDLFVVKISEVIKRCNNELQKVEFLCNCSGGVANIGVTISQSVCILVGVFLWSNSKIGIGSLMTSVQLSMCANEPIVKLINALVGFNSTKYLEKEFNENYGKTEIDTKTDKKLKCNIETLELKDISFCYPKQEKILFSHLSYKFELGKKYLLIGESGTGKTTLLKLMLGELENWKGCICINGKEETCMNKVLDFIAYVPQDVFIFDETIANNINILQKQDFNFEKIICDTNLSDLVSSKEQGINSIINEEVDRLSGGERARIGLARAVGEDKDIILIDEILSNLDKDNAYDLEKFILNIDKKLVIHIAHQYSENLKEQYDEIIELQGGKLVKR